MKVRDLGFRYLCRNILCIDNAAIARHVQNDMEANAVIACGFIHPEKGLCFCSLGTAVFDPYRRMDDGAAAGFVFTAHSVWNCPVRPVRMTKAEVKQAAKQFEQAVRSWQADPLTEELRQDCRYDPWRKEQFPDHLMAETAAGAAEVRPYATDGGFLIAEVCGVPKGCTVQPGDRVFLELADDGKDLRIAAYAKKNDPADRIMTVLWKQIP